ncbi:hypothetical protein Cfor_01922 [Coptotermes formosanus]|uniref:carbonic anhydrase n=1 Tax=Coptotermes formosanus TaxID=36987 RepID=A0A6L2PPN5_COPFO|nr:hypothetical protein Cfor_01922 [Coptotermes formosanus]
MGELKVLHAVKVHALPVCCWRKIMREADDSRRVLATESTGHSFSYEGENGPDHWAEEYQTCAGKFQSPIDIEEHLVTQVRLPPLRFYHFDKEPVASTLTNNGHTVMLQLNITKNPSVSGGPLRGIYVFQQLHFHWGNNDSVGSEDTVNNHTFPLELHIVTYKKDYGNFDNATSYKDGLAVFAVFYEIYGGDNPVYAKIIERLPQVKEPNTEVHFNKGVTLGSLLPETKHLYFTYNGSLTTPPCLEVVTWIEFKQPILLSDNQVNAFRTLRSPEGELTHNFRPVQPLSGRPVWFNVADNYHIAPWGRNGVISPFVTSFSLGIFLVLMLVALQQ